jgi:hypothetical protein
MTTRPGYVWDATTSEWVEIGQAAVVAPVAYQASEPSSPATGDIWIDSDDEVPSVDSTLYYRWTKTMSGGETSLSGTDDNSLALEYTPGYESVFINGVLQVRGSDYVATTGTTVTGLTALTASDVVMVESIVAYSVGDTYTQSQISSLLDAKSNVGASGMTLLSTTTLSGASTTVSGISQAYADLEIWVYGTTNATGNNAPNFRPNSTINLIQAAGTSNNGGTFTLRGINDSNIQTAVGGINSNTENAIKIRIQNYASTTNYKNLEYVVSFGVTAGSSTVTNTEQYVGIIKTNSAITSMQFVNGGGNWLTGTVKIWGC